jgi:hypothetical protein
LKDALKQRRNRKQKIVDSMKEKQQDEVLRAVEEGTDKLIQKNITDQKDS